MKKCDLCGKNPAAMKVRQMDKDGNRTEIEVCVECARKRGFTEVEKLKFDVAQILAEMKDEVADEDRKLICSRCGLSFAEFKRQGRLGCAGCYDTFREKLEPLVRRIHNAVQHVGKTTNSGRKHAEFSMNVQKLREDLQTAIKAEDYERAARLRDELSQAEKYAGGG